MLMGSPCMDRIANGYSSDWLYSTIGNLALDRLEYMIIEAEFLESYTERKKEIYNMSIYRNCKNIIILYIGRLMF